MEQNSRIIYADLFPLDTTWNEVKEVFSVFGKVKYINMPTFHPDHPLNKEHSSPRCKGYAFIEYHTKDDAKKACDFLNDLNNILILDQKPPDNKDAERPAVHEEIRSKLLDNPRHVALMPLRVMLKSVYLDLVRQCKEQRYQSLMRAAKTLTII